MHTIFIQTLTEDHVEATEHFSFHKVVLDAWMDHNMASLEEAEADTVTLFRNCKTDKIISRLLLTETSVQDCVTYYEY